MDGTTTLKTQYVCGFMFDQDAKHVALIRKERPAWQRGKLNGIGGKVEPNEGIVTAMAREFMEETGQLTRNGNWSYFCLLEGDNFLVPFFAVKTLDSLADLKSTTDEEVKILHVDDHCIVHSSTALPNLKWLVPMALQSFEVPFFAHVVEGRNDGLDENGYDK